MVIAYTCTGTQVGDAVQWKVCVVLVWEHVPSWNRANSRSKGLGFDSHCWSYVEVPGKLLISYRLCIPSSDGHLMDENCGSGCLHTCMMCAVFSQARSDYSNRVAYTREGIWLVEYGINIRS